MLKLKYSTYWQIALASLAFLFVFNSCSDKEDDVEPAVKKYRLKTISTVDGLAGFNLIYNSDNRVEKFTYAENGIEKKKDEWAWVGNKVTINHHRLENNTWVNYAGPMILYYENGKLAKSVDSLNLPAEIKIYTWNGDLLATETWADYDGDTSSTSLTRNYIYEDGLLTTITSTSYGILYETTSIEYSDGRPLSIKTYSNNKLTGKVELTHSGENITSITSYSINNGVETGIYCIETRAYDVSNRLTSISGECNPESMHFTYDEGVGNFYDLSVAQGAWINVYLFPDAFPSVLVR